MRKTIDEDLLREAGFLRGYDRFRGVVERLIDMPERTLDLLFRFLNQNGGRLSKRAREGEFLKLTDAEVGMLEEAYAEIFRAG